MKQKTLDEDEFCNYSGLPSPLAYQQDIKKITFEKWEKADPSLTFEEWFEKATKQTRIANDNINVTNK